MEMKGLIIGVGAAGNKSVINLVENEVISKDDIMERALKGCDSFEGSSPAV